MPVPCNRCSTPLPKWELDGREFAVCPDCGAANIVRVFPALVRGAGGASPAEAAGEGEATCFDHPGRRAAAVCAQCGRFVCELCAVELEDAVWCPTCVASGSRAVPAAEFENSRTLYDSLALTMAAAPLLFWPITVFTAPAALYLALRYWKRPLSLVRRSRWRLGVAVLLSLSEVGVWIGGAAYLLLQLQRQI